MRAVEVREVKIRTGWAAWLFGALDETAVAMNAVCANPSCGGAGEPLRIDRDGVRRLRGNAPALPPAQPPPPVERPHREPIELKATPGLEWTRGAR